MKRLPALIAAMLMLGSCALPVLPAGEDSSQETSYRAGEYRGVAQGYAGELTAFVTLTDSHIDAIRVPDCPETEGIGSVAVEQLPGLIVANQTFAVDVVAGATATSRALIEAAKQAVSASGADPAPLLEPPAQPVRPSLRAEVHEADLIVVGAGGAGLTAALAAAQSGPELRIVLLEKNAVPGGNTLLAGGGINAAASAVQQKAGVEDGFEEMLSDSLAVSGAQEGGLLETLAGDSAAVIDWLAEAGMPLEQLAQLPGSSAERAHLPENAEPVGKFLIDGLTGAVRRAGVEILCGTRASELLTDEEGRISGVIAESPGVRHLYTGGAVILATGGFAANDKLCGSYHTLLRGLDTVSSAAAQGDGIAMAQELGAATADMAEIVIEPTVHRGSGLIVPRALREGGALLVNRSGERFADELADDAKLSEALLAQPGRCGWLIFGEGLLHLLPSALEERVLSGAGPEKLSRAAGLPAETLEETISDRNAELPEAADEDGNEPHPARLEGELYALEVAPGVKTTLGGLAITPEAEVLGAAGEPIPGLYAAGEVTGGVHGAAALPGIELAGLLVFGRRAGQNAAGWLSARAEGPESNDV